MTDPFETARNTSAGMPGHSMSADVGVREAGGDKLREALARYMAAVRVLGTRSTVEPSRSLFDERPISPAGLDAWIELNDAGQQARAALNAPTESVKAPEGVTQAEGDGAATVDLFNQEWTPAAMADRLDNIGNLEPDDDGTLIRVAEYLRSLAAKSDFRTALLDLSFANEAPIAWSSFRWKQFEAAMLAASPTPITADDAVAKERERCARIADEWCAENKAGAAKARKMAKVRGDNGMADMLDGAAIECNAIASAIRSLSPDTEGEGM